MTDIHDYTAENMIQSREIRTLKTQLKKAEDELDEHRNFLDMKIKELEDAKKTHKQSASCEFPNTCGGCHFYSGSIELAKQLLDS